MGMYIYFRAECYKKISKNALNKNCLEWNFQQKTPWTQFSIPPRSGVKGLQRLQVLKYYEVLEWESWLTLGLNSAKSTDCIEKCTKQKLGKIKFSQKTWWAHVLISPKSGARGQQRFAIFEIMHWSGKLGSL